MHYKAATQKKTKILPNSAKTINRAQPPKRHFKTEPQCLFLFSQQTSCIWLYSFRILHPKILAFLWHQILQKDALINQPTNHSTNTFPLKFCKFQATNLSHSITGLSIKDLVIKAFHILLEKTTPKENMVLVFNVLSIKYTMHLHDLPIAVVYLRLETYF